MGQLKSSIEPKKRPLTDSMVQNTLKEEVQLDLFSHACLEISVINFGCITAVILISLLLAQ